MAAYELGGGVYDNVGSVLDGTYEIGSTKSVVDHKGDTVPVSDIRYCVDIRNIAVGVAQRFQIDGLCMFLNGVLHFFQIVCVHKSCLYAILRESMSQQIVTATVNGFLSYNMISLLR